jgi:TRAP-type mannitol/chloroaromatic compound transport system substrate-binding protein
LLLTVEIAHVRTHLSRTQIIGATEFALIQEDNSARIPAWLLRSCHTEQKWFKHWESFDTSERQVIEDAAAAEYTRALAEFNANNALGLRRLRDQGAVKILKFSDSVLKELYRISKDVVAEAGSGDDLSKKIYASYQQFLGAIIDWSDIAEGAVLSSRRLV